MMMVKIRKFVVMAESKKTNKVFFLASRYGGLTTELQNAMNFTTLENAERIAAIVKTDWDEKQEYVGVHDVKNMDVTFHQIEKTFELKPIQQYPF